MPSKLTTEFSVILTKTIIETARKNACTKRQKCEALLVRSIAKATTVEQSIIWSLFEWSRTFFKLGVLESIFLTGFASQGVLNKEPTREHKLKGKDQYS